VIRACRELGIQSVLVYSEADAHSLPVHLADEAICIGPAAARDSYLNIPAIMSAALISGAQAIHPGYGFLSESADFSEVCRDHGLTFIGPPPEVLRLFHDKAETRAMMKKLGLPVIPGSEGPVRNSSEALRIAEAIDVTPFSALRYRLIANVDAAVHEHAREMPALLEKQVWSPVEWVASMRRAQGEGATAYVEFGPGNVLTGLAKRILSSPRIANVSDETTLREALPVLR